MVCFVNYKQYAICGLLLWPVTSMFGMCLGSAVPLFPMILRFKQCMECLCEFQTILALYPGLCIELITMTCFELNSANAFPCLHSEAMVCDGAVE